MKTMLYGVLVTLVFAPAHGAEAPPAKPAASLNALPLFADRVLARGKGVEVKQSQVDEAYLTFKANRASMGQSVAEDMRPKIEADILDKLIATQLFLSRATAADKAKGKEVCDQFIGEQIKQARSEEILNRQLRVMGLTPEQFRAQIAEQSVVKAVIDRELKSNKTISDAAARGFFEKNPGLFEEPESVRVSHILFSIQDAATNRELTEDQKLEKKRLAEKVLAEAKSGADFSSLVKKYSEDQASLDRGGEYAIVRSKPDRVGTVPEFEAAAFSLATNKISDIVTTRFGYHIIRANERIPAKKLEFAKVIEKIKESMMQDLAQKELPAYVEALKKEAGVEILAAGKK